MALYVKQDDNRTELQEKIAAELREKQIKNSLKEGVKLQIAKEKSFSLKIARILKGQKKPQD